MKKILMISILFLFSCKKEVEHNEEEKEQPVSQACYCGTIVLSNWQKITVQNNCSGNEKKFDAQLYVEYNYGDAYCTDETW